MRLTNTKGDSMKAVKKFKVCPKCKGEGGFDAYLHVWNGRCYCCGGSGKLKTKQYEEFCNAVTFMDNIETTVIQWDNELEHHNYQIEARIARGHRVDPNRSGRWKAIEELEHQIDEARKYYVIYRDLIKKFNETVVFVN